MNVQVTLYGPLRDAVGEKTATVVLPEEATVADALERLGEEFPDASDQLRAVRAGSDSHVIVVKNKVNVEQLDGGETTLTDDDSLRISPPIKGGRDGSAGTSGVTTAVRP